MRRAACTNNSSCADGLTNAGSKMSVTLRLPEISWQISSVSRRDTEGGRCTTLLCMVAFLHSVVIFTFVLFSYACTW